VGGCESMGSCVLGSAPTAITQPQRMPRCACPHTFADVVKSPTPASARCEHRRGWRSGADGVRSEIQHTLCPHPSSPPRPDGPVQHLRGGIRRRGEAGGGGSRGQVPGAGVRVGVAIEAMELRAASERAAMALQRSMWSRIHSPKRAVGPRCARRT
jgi:hypothetical protein